MPKLQIAPIELFEARLELLRRDYAAAQSYLLPESDESPMVVAVESIKYQMADARAAIEEIRLGIA